MSGADERVRPSKREAEQAVILLRCRQDRAPPLVHGAHVRGNLAPLARAALSPALPLGGLNATPFGRQRPYLASAAAFLLEKPHAGMITALIADAIPSPRPRLLQNCAPAPGKRRALLLHLDCCQACSRCSTKTSFGNRWPDGSNSPRAGSRRSVGDRSRAARRASAHDERSYRLATVIA